MGERTDAPRVVFVNNSHETFTPTVSGAIGTCIWQCCRAAARTGEQPVVITVDLPVARYAWPATIGLQPRRIPGGRPYQALRALRRLSGWAGVGQWSYARSVRRRLRRIQPDVVICSNDPEVALYLQRRFPTVTVVHWFHNLITTSDRFKREYGRSPVVSVAVSGYLARAVEAVYGLTPLSIATVFNGVDAEAFSPRPPVTGDEYDNTLPVIAHLGRLAVEKGADTLLRACLLMSTHRVDFRVELIGDTNWGRSEPTEFRGRIDALVGQLAAAGIVVARTGHLSRDDVPGALRRGDIHVIASRWDEPFGLALLEAMSTGLACVVSAVGGLPEVLGPAGTMFPRDDVAALAQCLERWLDDPSARAEFGRRARERALELSWDATWAGVRDAATTPPASAAMINPARPGGTL